MDFRTNVSIWFFGVRDFFECLRRRIWNKRILVFWNRLWLRSDELHHSLNLDNEAMFVMDEEEETKYREDVLRRRVIAHRKEA